MKTEIPWKALSSLFKDAIWLCRQLGIKYTWIDSLCIVQDDDTDWEVEAAKMAQYYSEARITIAVDSSPDGTTPFLSQRAERWQPQTSSSAPCLIVREHYDRTMETYLPGTIKLPSYFPEARHCLPTRAWAMQESFLSTRVVQFTPSDITWECDGMAVSEDGFESHEPSRPSFTAWININAYYQRMAIWKLWTRVVEDFTGRDITYATDRLPALSGMASRFQSIIFGRYLAGIWESYLIEGLSWIRLPQGERDIRAPGNKLAPTWSWVSMSERARVMFHFDLGIPKLPSKFRPEVLEVHCETSKSAPFGRVKGGHMSIKAPLFKATLTYGDRSSPERLKYMVSIMGSDDGEEPYTSHDLVVDYSLSIKDGNALRAPDEDVPEYMTDPASFTATAWIMWLGNGALVLGQDLDSKAFQRLGYLATSHPSSRVRSSPIDDPQRWTNSLKGAVIQLQLV
ncbi:hypothetical protein FALCPG4_016372 [Fusarium falciforme]